MKKYVLLYAFTGMAVFAILLAGQGIKGSIVRVTSVKVQTSTAEDTVICTGKVESVAGNDVYAYTPGVARRVYVKVGDKVTAGQPLMDIMPLAASSSGTASALLSNNAYNAYAAYLSQTQQNASSASSSSASSSGGEASGLYTLTALNDGIVQSLSVSEAGAYLTSDRPAAVIRSEDGLQVRLSVDEAQISDLKKGQKVQISGVGFKNSVYSGSIESISGEAKQSISTTGQETVVEVIASVTNPGADIKPGFTAKARITTSQSSDVLILPYEAVREDSDGKEFVYRYVNGRARKTVIVTGREFDSGFEVKSGVHANDIVVTDPDDTSDGAQIVVIGMVGVTHG